MTSLFIRKSYNEQKNLRDLGKEFKEKVGKYKVNAGEMVRKLLDKYLVELELGSLAERLELLKRLSGKIDPKLVAKLVREDREIRFHG